MHQMGGSSWLFQTTLPRIPFWPSFFPTPFQKLIADVQAWVQLSCTWLYSNVTRAVACACSTPPPLLFANSDFRMVMSVGEPSPQLRKAAYCDAMWLVLLAPGLLS